MRIRTCKTCKAELGELVHWCGACGAATPIKREESDVPKRRTSAADYLRAANHALARLKIKRGG